MISFLFKIIKIVVTMEAFIQFVDIKLRLCMYDSFSLILIDRQS